MSCKVLGEWLLLILKEPKSTKKSRKEDITSELFCPLKSPKRHEQLQCICSRAASYKQFFIEYLQPYSLLRQLKLNSCQTKSLRTLIKRTLTVGISITEQLVSSLTQFGFIKLYCIQLPNNRCDQWQFGCRSRGFSVQYLLDFQSKRRYFWCKYYR